MCLKFLKKFRVRGFRLTIHVITFAQILIMASFEDLGLNEQLLSSVKQLGFETPTAIQEKAIPVLLSGTKDFIGLAQTGTGKTAAFGLPLLQLVSASKRYRRH